MKRLFNALLYPLQCKSGISTDTFKGHLNKWLRTIPDISKIDSYVASMPAESNIYVNKENKLYILTVGNHIFILFYSILYNIFSIPDST